MPGSSGMQSEYAWCEDP